MLFSLLPCFSIPGEVFIKVKVNYHLQRYSWKVNWKADLALKKRASGESMRLLTDSLKLNLGPLSETVCRPLRQNIRPLSQKENSIASDY